MSAVTVTGETFARAAQPLTVRALRSAEDVAASRDALVALGPEGPDAHPEVLLAVLRSRAAVVRPHVLLVERAGRPVAALVARLEDRDAEARFGYATILRRRMRCLTVVHDGLFGPGRDEARPMLASALLASLDAGEADALFVHKLGIEDPLRRELSSRARALRRGRTPLAERHWSRRLPATFDDLTASMRRRKKRLYELRRTERDLGDRLRFVRYDRPEDEAVLCRDLEAVARLTYQRGLGAGFCAEHDAELIATGLRGGWYRAWVLYIDGVPRAFEYGDVLDGTYFLGGKGFDPAWREHGLGRYVELRVLMELCADPAVRRIDFGFGDAGYKRELADEGWDEADLTIVARRPSLLALNAVQSGIVAADTLARRIAGAERAARVKRRWRALRTPAQPEGPGDPAASV